MSEWRAALLLPLLLAAPAASQSLVYEACAPNETYQFFGGRVASVGDIDDDGRGDLAVTEGDYVYATQGVAVLSGRLGEWIFDLPGSGFSVAGPGDATGDGVPDVAAFAYTVGAAGGLRVFSGADGSQALHVPYTDSSIGGEPLHAAGDVDGDGLGDLLLHAASSFGDGEARLVSGLDGSLLWSHDTYSEFPIAALGDLDSDGVTEVGYVTRTDFPVIWTVHVVSPGSGAELFTLDSAGNQAYVWPFATGDVDADGVPDIGVDGTAPTTIWSGAGHALITTISDISYNTKGVGDVNADGFADIAFLGEEGAPPFSGFDRGLHVVLGPDATPLHTFDGTYSVEASWGQDFAGIGDVDGDERPDLVVTVPNVGAGLAPPGCVQILGFGPATLFEVTPLALSLGATAADATLTLSGYSLDSLTGIEWDGQLVPVPGAGVEVLGPTELRFDPPAATGLGPATVQALNPGGASNPLVVLVGETHPPVLVVPELAQSGEPLTWSWYGEPAVTSWLVGSLKPDTFVFKGWTVLRDFDVLSLQILDGDGVGGLSLELPAGLPPFLYAWSQVVTLQHGGPLEASEIKETLIYGAG